MTQNPPDPQNDVNAAPLTAEIVAKPAARAAGAAWILAVLAFLTICWAAKDLLVPVMLAAFLAAVANPLVKRLCRFWIPRWVGALTVVVGGLVMTVYLASLLVG